MSFDADLTRVERLLSRRGRVSMRAIRLELGTDDDYVQALGDELVEVLGVARWEDGVLVAIDAAAASHETAAERRQVTFLFCDVVSSTELSMRVDHEALREAMLRYQAAAGDAVGRHGGHVSQWIGDGVVVFYGFPDAHDDDAVRAVHTGLDIVDAVQHLPPAADGTRLHVRVGVHTGPVVVGGESRGAARELPAFGATPNICARIESAAETDTVFVSDDTRRLIEGYFELEDRGLFELKGVEAPMRLHRVVAAADIRDRFDVAVGRGLLPLVGRAAERRAIELAWQRAGEGTATAVVLAGEPGIGKSRLAHYCRSLVDAPARLVAMFASPRYQASDLHPVATAVAGLLGLDQLLSDADRMAAITAALGDGAETVGAFVAQLLGVPVPDPADPGMTPQRRRAMTLDALAGLICEAAADHPLLLLVEDAHWLDPSTDELLRMILGRMGGTKLMLLATTRPVHTRQVEPFPGAETIHMEPLGGEEAAELARLTLGAEVVSEGVLRSIAAKSDGVPLYVEELARAHSEAGLLDDAAMDAAGRSIPDTLASVLQARLDRLSPPARRLAQVAAAIGRDFPTSLLETVARLDPTSFKGRLDELQRAELIRPTPGIDGFEFRHALLQEAAASSVLHADARSHHGAVAAALIDRGAAEPEIVAPHLEAAGDAAGAVGYWMQAGLGALQRSAIAESVSHLRAALKAVASMPASSGRDELELQLQVLIAIPYTLSRGWASAEVGAAFTRADTLLQTVQESPHLYPTLVGLLTYDIVRGAHQEAHERAVRYHSVAAATGDDQLMAEAELNMGTTLFYLGRTGEALQHLDRVEGLYDPGAHHATHVMLYAKDPGAVALLHASLAEAMLGRHDAGLAKMEAALRRTEQWVHPFSRLWAQDSACLLHQVRGDVPAVGALAAQVVADATEQGFPNWVAQCLVYLGWATAASGSPGEGLDQIRRGIEIWQMTGAAIVMPVLLALEAEVLGWAGDPAAARGVLREALEVAHLNHEHWWTPELHRMLGEAHLALGDREEARACFEQALARARDQQVALFELRAAMAVATLLGESGRGAEAAALLRSPLAAIQGGDELAEIRAAAELAAALG